MKRRILMLTTALLLLCLVCTLAACKKEAPTYQLKQRPETVEHGPVGMDNIMNIASISRLNDNLYNYGSSSYNRENSNNDGFTSGNFLYVDDEGRYVICDAKGSGVLTRIWMLGTATSGNSHLEVYIDGSEEPVLDVSFRDFISGNKPPFNKTFCTSSGQGGVSVCYLTMEFEESIYAVMTEPNGFWQVDYTMMEENDGAITSLTGKETYPQEAIILDNLGNPVVGYTDTYEATVSTKTGKTSSVLHLDGPRQISYIEMKLDGLALPKDLTDRTSQNFREILNGLSLVINWDGFENASVDAPFGLLFGMGSLGYNRQTKALMYGVKDDGTLYLYFPMPFEKSADVSIRNSTGQDIDVQVKIGYCNVNSDFYNIGYFTTDYSNYYVFCQDPFEAVMLDVPGSGKVVSIQENIFGQVGNVWYEEGDHRIYVDGSVTPQMIGCGTEDFYNGCGYFILNNDAGAKLGLYSRMFSGYTNYLSLYDAENSTLNEAISVYRTFITDPINFRNGIRMTFEHGGGEFSRSPSRTWNTNQTAGYEVLVCYYYQPVAKMAESDSFLVSDKTAAQAHGYTAAGTQEQYSLNSSFYGSFCMIKSSKEAVKTTGEISFTMKLDAANYGAVLYRVYDQYDLNMGAAVFVDGEYVGEWYKAGQNTTFRFADDYFPIPERFTKGKTAITITLKPNTESAWNAIEYKLFSRTDTLVENNMPSSGKVYNIYSKKNYIDHVDSEFDMGGSYSSNPVTVAKKSDAVEQDFRLIRYSGNVFFIIGQGSGTLLSQEGDQVIRKMYPNSKLGEAEMWELIADGDGYLIRNVSTGKYMKISGSSLTMADKGTRFTFSEVTERKLCIF